MERPFQVSESLYPFTSHWREIEGLPVHYIDEGEGEPILFFHGNPTWSFLYRDVIRGLRDRFRCIAVDYPGMGMSGKPRDHGHPTYGFTPREHSRVIEGLVRALDLKNLTVMVQDWGGPIGLGVAVRNPERIARLVIGNTWAWPVQGFRDIEFFSKSLGGPLGHYAILRWNLFVRRLLPAGVAKRRAERMTPEVMAAYEAPYPTREDRLPTAVFPREILGSRQYLAEVEQGLPRLADRPVLIVWGDKDLAFKKRELDRWRGIFPQATVRILEGAGHFIQEDAPEEIVEAITKFMGK
ncbi:MAG: alpha/beta fold hydrolase [Myxococcales bacterium]|nr:alpha/beta fold hydrolase [Myxococcales bacterium]